ncbi:hypothetical protein SLS57_008042 [Botryosphaeria dothidea]
MAISIAMPWSDGERAMQDLLRVPRDMDNPTSSFMTPQAAAMLVRAPLLALGALDADHRPWAALWGGEPGFSQPLGNSIFGVRSPVDRRFDPVAQALVDGKTNGEVIKEEGRGRMVAGLPIDLVTRKRVKIYGRMVVASMGRASGGAEEEEAGKEEDDQNEGLGQMQLVIKVEQSLGNCPKYLNSKSITPATPRPQLESDSPTLSAAARALVAKSDLFFISSSNGTHDMDVNHRGGPAGFIRVQPSSDPSAPTTLVYPEYSGNRYYQTVGNLRTTPLAGLCIPDFATGDVLYATGRTTIHANADAARLLPRSNLAIAIELTAAKLVRNGLSFRGNPTSGVGSLARESSSSGMSPYNPPVRLLAAEGSLLAKVGEAEQKTALTATLTRKEVLTEMVARFTFALSAPTMIGPGQWVALDASGELDQGYSHMRNDDPESLNDDFVRTFTVTGADGWGKKGENGGVGLSREFNITARRHGPVTGMLFGANERAGLEFDIRGFGGEFRVEAEEGESQVPFVAGGVGITPLLAELTHDLDPARVQLFWTLRAADVKLVGEVFEKYPALASRARVFFTGGNGDGVGVDGLKAKGAVVEFRRLAKEDFGQVKSKRWYLCAGTPLRKEILRWLEGKGEVLFEDFNF